MLLVWLEQDSSKLLASNLIPRIQQFYEEILIFFLSALIMYLKQTISWRSLELFKTFKMLYARSTGSTNKYIKQFFGNVDRIYVEKMLLGE